MFSKRTPVGEKLAGVTGRPRRWADHSWFSTLSLARDRATLFPRVRVLVHTLLRRWSQLDAEARAGTDALSIHQGSCRLRRQLRQDLQLRSWESPEHSAQREHSILISSASRREFPSPPAPAPRLPQQACVQEELHPAQKRK